LRSGFKPARGSRLGAKSVGSDFTGSRRMSNFKESPSPPYASGYGILRLRSAAKISRRGSRRPRGTRAAPVQTLRRPGPRLPTVSSKWMMLLNETSQFQDGGSTHLRDRVLHSSESALGVLQTCTGETAAPPASSRPVSVGGRVYSADVPVGHCDHGPKDPHRFT
jgi:hypothetical protein